MAWFKRIALFLALNLIIVLTISTLTSVLGLDRYLYQGPAGNLNYTSLALFCLVWGMGGAFISLALSRIMAKWMMGVKLVPEHTADPRLHELRATVYELSRAAGLSTMPEVGIYDSPELNAFATGPSKSRSLVAVSTGLLQRMDRREMRGVLAHEVAHIANGDMVTMTLLQGVVNAFVMFLARVIAFAVSQVFRGDDEESPSMFAFYAVQIVLEIIFMIFGSMLVAAFSRWREFRADKGGAGLGGRDSMVAALEALKANYRLDDRYAAQSSGAAALNSFKIESHKSRGLLMRLFASHPELDERIARLRNAV